MTAASKQSRINDLCLSLWAKGEKNILLLSSLSSFLFAVFVCEGLQWKMRRGHAEESCIYNVKYTLLGKIKWNILYISLTTFLILYGLLYFQWVGECVQLEVFWFSAGGGQFCDILSKWLKLGLYCGLGRDDMSLPITFKSGTEILVLLQKTRCKQLVVV